MDNFFDEIAENNELYINFLKKEFFGEKFEFDAYEKSIKNELGYVLYDAGRWAPSFDYWKVDLKGKILAKLLNDERVKEIFSEIASLELKQVESVEAETEIVEEEKPKRGRPKRK